jgi:hypothetical protein
MKADFKTWFARLPAMPGMLACGVRQPNGKCIGYGDDRIYPAEKIEKLLGQFAGLHEPLAAAEFSPRWTTWAFEYGHLRFVMRPDKRLLMLLVSPDTEAVRELDRIAEEFLAGTIK